MTIYSHDQDFGFNQSDELEMSDKLNLRLGQLHSFCLLFLRINYINGDVFMNNEFEKIINFDPEKEMAWYAISFFTNYDNKVLSTLNTKLKDPVEFGSDFDECIMISQEITETKRGKEVKKTVNMMPGYLYCHCIMTDKVWYAIRNTPGITGIIGSHGKASKPTPIPQEEMDPLLALIGRSQSRVLDPTVLKLGSYVRILSGPFVNKEGIIKSINTKANTVLLSIDAFGRELEIEINLADIASK